MDGIELGLIKRRGIAGNEATHGKEERKETELHEAEKNAAPTPISSRHLRKVAPEETGIGGGVLTCPTS